MTGGWHGSLEAQHSVFTVHDDPRQNRIEAKDAATVPHRLINVAICVAIEYTWRLRQDKAALKANIE